MHDKNHATLTLIVMQVLRNGSGIGGVTEESVAS